MVGMVEVPDRPLGTDGRDELEVVRDGGRLSDPFEGHAVPRVRADLLAFPQRLPHVYEEGQDRKGEYEGADRREHVEEAPAGVGRVSGDAPLHTPEAEVVLREEGQVEADEHDDERDLP